jgi:hypothetical protein
MKLKGLHFVDVAEIQEAVTGKSDEACTLSAEIAGHNIMELRKNE